MTVLIADDDETKVSRIYDVVLRASLPDGVALSRAKSVTVASRLMREKAFDLVILDVNLPMRDGEAPRRDGGVVLIKLIGDRRLIGPAFTIGLTAYDELASEFADDFTRENCHLLKYDLRSDQWEDRLTRLVTHAEQVVNRCGAPGPTTRPTSHIAHKVDVAVVVPLEEEFQRLLTAFGEPRGTDVDEKTGRHVYLFEIPGVQRDAPYSCAVSVIGEMGPTEARC